jgi:hypothetical protein
MCLALREIAAEKAGLQVSTRRAYRSVRQAMAYMGRLA